MHYSRDISASMGRLAYISNVLCGFSALQRGSNGDSKSQEERRFPSMMVAFGPEGGWIPTEFESLQEELGFLPFRMTDTILKCESALDFCFGQLSVLQDPVLRCEVHSIFDLISSKLLNRSFRTVNSDSGSETTRCSSPVTSREVVYDEDGFVYSLNAEGSGILPTASGIS